jgi:hypothetical protein
MTPGMFQKGLIFGVQSETAASVALRAGPHCRSRRGVLLQAHDAERAVQSAISSGAARAGKGDLFDVGAAAQPERGGEREQEQAGAGEAAGPAMAGDPAPEDEDGQEIR